MSTKGRNMGIDMLRVICMMAMVIQHVLGHGWVMALIEECSWKYELLRALRSSCLFGISCFALISGYVGVRSRYKYSALLQQWAKVWFYSVSFTWIISMLFPGQVSGADWNKAFFPTLQQQYWYFTAYAGSFMLAPFIRIAVRKMNFKQASFCTGMLVLVFSVLNTLQGGDPFFANCGKGTIWLVVHYAVGAYFGEFKPHEKVPMRVLWGFAACSLILLAGLQPVSVRMGWSYLSGEPRNDSPVTLLTAVAMMLLFSRISVTRGQKLVSALGATSFGVYLIHDHPLIRRYTISTYSYPLAGLDTLLAVPGVILASAGIYMVCMLIDMLRQKLFDLLRVKQMFAALENKLVGNLWDD